MLAKEVHDYILNLDLCHICVLRYTNVDYQNEEIFKEFQTKKTAKKIKRSRLNICAACLGIFHELDTVAKNIIENSNLTSYECTSLYSSIQIPINISIRDLSIWIDLIENFPEKINTGKSLF